jgi:type IV pilus assembly protein PilO
MSLQALKEIIKVQPRTFLLILIIALAAVGLYLFSSVVLNPKLAGMQTSWFEKRKSSSSRSYDEMSAVYRQGEADLKSLRNRIVRKKDFARFVGNVLQIAGNNSLNFNGISYKSSQIKNENLAVYNLDFNLSGKYAGIKNFISEMGHRPEILTLDQISLIGGKITEDSVALKLQMTVYLRMEE